MRKKALTQAQKDHLPTCTTAAIKNQLQVAKTTKVLQKAVNSFNDLQQRC